MSLVAAITACETNEADIDATSEYVFSLIDSGGIWRGSSMECNPANREIIYISATDQQARKTYFNKLDTSDGSIEKLEVDYLFDSDYALFEIFPLIDGGFYIFARTPAEEKQILKRFSADFEPMFEIDLLDHIELAYSERYLSEVYEYSVCGVTENGDAVIWTPEEVFTVAPNNEKRDTWEYVNASGHRTSTKALVSGDDILRCEYDFTLNVVYLSWLRADGIIEPYAEINSIYSTIMLDNGAIFVAVDSEQTLYMLGNQGELEFLLDYSDGRSNRNFHKVIVLSDSSFLAYISFDFYIISKSNGDWDGAEEKDRKIITIATYGHHIGLIKEYVNIYLQKNTGFSIEIIDYSEYDDGIARLNVEIIAAAAPDLIYWGYGKQGIVGNFDPEVYSRAGVLVDLYGYMDNDYDIGSGTILPNLLKTLESTSGELYEMPLAFILQLYAGSIDVLGTEQGWTFEDYFALLEEHPDATLPFGSGSWELFLWDALSNNYGAFIDWEKGEAYFDTDEFAGLLQITKTYWDPVSSRLEIKSIQEGKQLLSRKIIGDVSSIQVFEALFGTGVNYIGFPTMKGVGNSFVLNGSISINAASEYKDECWEFIKTLLAYDVQLNSLNGFPVNCDALDERLDNAAQYEEAGSSIGYYDSEGDTWRVTYTDATSEEITTVRGLIESIDRVYRDNSDIMTIIEEVAPSYFSGDRTLEDAVEIIQSRAQIYVSEQSW